MLRRWQIHLYILKLNGRRNRTLHLYVVTATNLGLRRSDPEPTQRCRTACGQDLVVVVGVKGGGEKFLDGEILKTTTVGPLQYDDYYTVLSRAPVRSNMDKQYSITSPDPQLKASTTSHRQTSERANKRTNEQIYGPS